MTGQSILNLPLGDLDIQLEAKNNEIQCLKNEVLKLQLLLEKSQKFCSKCDNELSALDSKHTRLCPEKYELSVKVDISDESKCNQTCLCHCLSHLEPVSSSDVGTQTFETDFFGAYSLGSAEDWKPPEGSNCTVADLVKQVVEEVSSPSDYVYDENYKMYYSPSTGYYFDTERNLLYDSHSGTYYSYDSQRNTYEFYYQVQQENELQTDTSVVVSASVNNLKITSQFQESRTRTSQTEQNQKAKRKMQKKIIKTRPDVKDGVSDYPELEIRNLTVDERKDDVGFLEEDEVGSPYAESSTTEDSYYLSSMDSPASVNFEDDTSESWPPCVRLIVEESSKLQIGSLLLITCTGAIVGRDKNHRLCIPDFSVSKTHAETSYDNETCQYYVTDLGSQNGTFINDTRLSQPKENSPPHILKHGDHICFGFCKLLVHIHPGTETCDECEPGQVQAKFSEQAGKFVPLIQSKEEKETERRRHLRQLKKKFGLQNMSYENDSSATKPCGTNYHDRTKERQKSKGSDNPYEKTAQPASLDITIPSDNKGYQLLKKMGWKEGEALGAKTSGETEPVPINVRTNRAGFGSSSIASSPIPLDPRNRKWRKAQRRYRDITQELPPSASGPPKFVEATHETH